MSDETHSRLDWPIFALLIALLTFMPLAFGTLDPHSEFVAFSAAGAIALLLGVRMILRGGRSSIHWSIFLPITGFICLAAIQLTPLSTRIVRIISKRTAFTKADLLSDAHGGESFLKWMTLSFDPTETRHHLRLVLLATVIFCVVLTLCRSAKRIRMMLAAMALIGGTFAMLAMAQGITRTSKTLWIFDRGYPPFNATFANHSHYSQFMNLAVGAALGLLLARLRGTTTLLTDGYDGPAEQRFRQNIWWPCAVIVVGLTTIALSLSRGGMISILVAAGFTIVVLGSRRGVRTAGAAFALMLVVGFAWMAYLGIDRVAGRVQSLRDVSSYQGRLRPALDATIIFKQFPLLGVGLGSHESFFPRFNSELTYTPSQHVENEYAQVAEEMGATGLFCVVSFIAILWVHWSRSMRRSDSPTAAASIGLGYGLLAVMTHSLSDFGQHVPAVAGMSAATCALLINAARVDRPENTSRITLPRSAVGAMLLILTIVGGGWLLWDAFARHRAGQEWDQILPLSDATRVRKWNATDKQYAELIAGAESAIHFERGNISYHYWLALYRWHALLGVRDFDAIESVLLPVEHARAAQIVDDLHRARPLCPTFGPAYALAGRIELFALGRVEGEKHIQQGFALAPSDPDACFLAGLVDGRRGQWESCVQKFQSAYVANNDMFAKVVTACVRDLKRPELTLDFAGNDLNLLFPLIGELKARKQPAVAEAAQGKIVQVLEQRVARVDADATSIAQLAEMELSRGQLQRGVDLYARALGISYARVEWRISRGRALVKLGRLNEAAQEMDLCRALAPNDNHLQFLIAELNDARKRKKQ